MRREVTGRRSSYFDWMGAGCYVAGSEQGAMYRSERILKEIHFGNDTESLYLRLDPLLWKSVTVRIEFHGPRHAALEFALESFVGLASYRWTDALGTVSQHRALAALEGLRSRTLDGVAKAVARSSGSLFHCRSAPFSRFIPRIHETFHSRAGAGLRQDLRSLLRADDRPQKWRL